MKKYFFLLFFILSISNVIGQSKNNKYSYAKLIGKWNMSQSKISISVDLGSDISKEIIGSNTIEQLSNLQFSSMVDAMNTMETKGWEFVQAYNQTRGDFITTHWVIRKKVE